MSDITEQEIEQIASDIDEQGLTYLELKNELLDHICCEIEEAMEQGMMFNDAYKKVREEMGKKRIRQIQHETLSLINKKYRRMKRTMYGLGIVSPVIVVIASIFKFMHWSGGSLLMTIGLFLIGMIFLPLFVMTRIRDTRRLDEELPMGLYITGMSAGMISILGALFKIQHWPGANVLITVGLVVLALVFLPMFASVRIKKARKNGEPIDKKLLISGVIAGALLTLGTLFKIMHWPGAGIVILVSWSAVAVLFLPYLVLGQLKKPKDQLNNFLAILLVATAAAIFIMALLRSQPRTLISGFLAPESNFSATAGFYENQIPALSNAIEMSGNMDMLNTAGEIQEAADEICNYVESVKEEVFKHLFDEDEEFRDSEGNLDMSMVKYKGDIDKLWEIIVERDEFKLFSLLENFKNITLSKAEDPQLKDFIQKNLLFLPENDDDKMTVEWQWAVAYFNGPFLQSASVLSAYESNVRLIEYQILSELLHQNNKEAV
ncbi:MAG: hypothetical protein K9J30_12130 [Bacteroidales bacterium]|nr:hypothetical protein [Bacteroidales bacterium]